MLLFYAFNGTFRKKNEIEIKEKMERERKAIAAEKERKEAQLL